jgi:hypothetical protein
MASIRVSYRFADGDEIETEAYVDSSAYPDAAADARAEAMRAFREAFAFALAELKGDE